MQDHDFLQAICESPDDVAPRLVYADWLDDEGDPRGEFIRVQCERSTLSERDPRCRDLDFRERSLLAQYRNVWAKPVRKWGRVIEYHRGFVEDITLKTDAFLKSGDEFFSLSPIRRVKLTHLKDQVEALANCPLLSRVQELSLRDTKLGLAKLKVFLKSPWIKNIQGFDFGFNGLRISAVRELIAAKSLGPLKSLTLDGFNLDSAGLQLLLESHLVDHLEKLKLCSNQLTNDDVALIANCPKLSQLKELDLDFNPALTSRGIRQLLESENLKSLRELSLRDCPIDAKGDTERAFPAKSPLADLVRLSLDDTGIREAGMRQLAESEWVDRLVHLSLSKNYSDSSMYDPLLQPGRLPHLRTLLFKWNHLNHHIVEGIARLGHSSLTKVDLGGRIGNKGAKLLAQSEEFQNLNILDLQGFGITDPGAKALAKSKTLNRIAALWLTVSQSGFSWNKTPGVSHEVVKSLVARFGKHVCYFD
jgi:uncharacterized protein (TIGR02996 family)